MKRFFICFVFIAIILSQSSCTKKNNPVNVESKSAWTKVAQIGGLSDAKIYFLNENVGFVSADVYLAPEIHLQTKIIKKFSVNDTTFTLAENSVLNKDLDPSICPLWKTTDGGHTWKPIKGYFKTSVKDIYFADDQTGFLVTQDEGVFKTIDCGESWFRIFGSYIEAFAGQTGSSNFAFPKEVCFYDKDHGFIYTEGSLPNLYLFTNDGGYNWNFKYILFRGENYVFPESGKEIGYADENGIEIAKTNDGGLTWNRIAGLSSANDLISFADNTNGVYSDGEQLFRTTDGGLNFTRIHDLESGYQWQGYPAKILFKNPKECYIVIDNKIGISGDACKTIGDLSAPKSIYRDISFPSDKIGYAINSDGEVYKYNTGN